MQPPSILCLSLLKAPLFATRVSLPRNARERNLLAFLRERARFIRLETVRLIGIAKTGHYSSVFSAAELFRLIM